MQAAATYLILGYAVSRAELLAGGAMVLAIVAILVALGRKRRIALQRSLVTDELMVHLARIADVLERQAARPIQVILPEPPKRSEDPPPQKKAEQTGSIAYSMFGR